MTGAVATIGEADAAAMLASHFQSTPRTASAVNDAFSPRSAGSAGSAGADRPLAEVMETLATLSRRVDDQAASATAALSPAATSASARAALDFECETFDRGFSVVSNASLITEDYYNLLKRKPA